MKMSSLDQSITLGQYAHQIIHRHVGKILDRFPAVLKDQDPEPLHQMRVEIRRLRTALQIFGPAIILPKAVNSASIGKIGKRLGSTRDLDVLQDKLTTHYQPCVEKTERSKFTDVLKQLQHRRKHSFKQLQKTLDGDRYHQIMQALHHWDQTPLYTPIGHLAVSPLLPDLLLPLLCQLFLHPGWLVGTTLEAGKATPISLENSEALAQQGSQLGSMLHDLRKHMKGVRYQTEFFVDFYGEAYRQQIEPFKVIQDILGEFQDQVVLRDCLESSLKANLAQVLPSIDTLMHQEQANFWPRWQPIQCRYLSSEFRALFRAKCLGPRTMDRAVLGNINA